MMVLHHQLEKIGHQVSFFHPQHQALASLFPHACLDPYPSLNDFEKVFSLYDRVILQNDHSERAWHLFKLRQSNQLDNLTVLFVTPYPKEHRNKDFVFRTNFSFVENLRLACQHLFSIHNATIDNGLPFSKNQLTTVLKKVMIHPTSKDPKRNWPKKKFIELAFFLKKMGYEPHFCVSTNEYAEWDDIPIYGMKLHSCDKLELLAKLLCDFDYFIGNDSGMGHLASNLKIPTLTISGNKKRVMRWRPGWYLNHIVTLSFPIPNFKGCVFSKFDGRLRDNYWQNFISVGKVLKGFKHLAQTHQKSLSES